MKLSSLFLAVPAALFVLGSGAASAGEAISDAGAFACVADKWDETEPEKAHKWVDYVGRCVGIPDASAAPKYTEDCVGKFEYMPDGSWKGSGTCTFNFKGGDKMYGSFEEGKATGIDDGVRNGLVGRDDDVIDRPDAFILFVVNRLAKNCALDAPPLRHFAHFRDANAE